MKCPKPIYYIVKYMVWGIDFMRLFPNYHAYLYILLVVEYISNWVEGKPT